MVKIKTIMYFAVFFVLITVGCRKSSPSEDSLATLFSGKGEGEIVARIGSYELTAGRLNYMYNTLPPSLRRNYDKYGGIERFLVDFSEQKAVVLEMSKTEIADYEDVSVQIERGIDQALFNQMLEHIAYQSVTEEALEKYYNDHPEEFHIPEMVRARHIFTSPEKESSLNNELNDDAVGALEAKKKIDKLANRLEKGEDFATLAKKYSEDTSAPKGGDVGFFKRGDMVLPFEEAAFNMEPGEVSSVVESKFGFHIIEVTEKKEAVNRSFEEAREDIRKKLFPLGNTEKKDSFIREQINNSAKNNKIEIYRENIINF